MRAAASRTFCTAGSSRPIRMAMIAITTSSSMRVKPQRRRKRAMRRPPKQVKRVNETTADKVRRKKEPALSPILLGHPGRKAPLRRRPSPGQLAPIAGPESEEERCRGRASTHPGRDHEHRIIYTLQPAFYNKKLIIFSD